MRERIERIVDLILPHFGVYDPGERHTFLEGVFHHLENDRERYVSLEKEGKRRIYAPTLEGRICKLLPLAEKVEIDNDEDGRHLTIDELHLMVTEKRVRLVLSQTAAHYITDREPSIFFPSYTVADPFNLPEQLTLLTPVAMKKRIDPREDVLLPMAMRAIGKFFDGTRLYQIPLKAERCMSVFRVSNKEKYTMQTGEEVEGILIPMASAQMEQEFCSKEKLVMASRELCILQMENEARYVMKTVRDITYYKDPDPGSYNPFDDDDDDDCDAMLDRLEEERTYSFVELSDVNTAMTVYY